jgi:hypothetical protein
VLKSISLSRSGEDADSLIAELEMQDFLFEANFSLKGASDGVLDLLRGRTPIVVLSDRRTERELEICRAGSRVFYSVRELRDGKIREITYTFEGSLGAERDVIRSTLEREHLGEARGEIRHRLAGARNLLFDDAAFLALNLDSALFRSCTFRRLNATYASCREITFSECMFLDDCRLDGADLTGALFERCALGSNIHLTNSRLDESRWIANEYIAGECYLDMEGASATNVVIPEVRDKSHLDRIADFFPESILRLSDRMLGTRLDARHSGRRAAERVGLSTGFRGAAFSSSGFSLRNSTAVDSASTRYVRGSETGELRRTRSYSFERLISLVSRLEESGVLRTCNSQIRIHEDRKGFDLLRTNASKREEPRLAFVRDAAGAEMHSSRITFESSGATISLTNDSALRSVLALAFGKPPAFESQARPLYRVK